MMMIMTVNMRMMMMLRQDQAEKWVRSRKRSPLPFIFVVPPSKDRFDIFAFLYSCILYFFLYSPIFIFVCHLGNTSCKKRMFSLPELPLPGRGLPPIFSDNGQKNFFFDQNEPFWGEKQLNVPAGIDGPTWCERCGRKRRKSKRIIQFNRYLALGHNGRNTKIYPAGCLASGRLDLKQRISLKSRNPWISLKLKSHIFYYQVNPVT